MTQYSLAGYLSAIEMRGSRTLLVEGITDQQILSRVLNSLVEDGMLSPDSVVVDTADLIDRTGLYMGVREFVEHVHQSSTAPADRFFVVIDREFRGFDLGPPPADRIGGHHTPAPNCMWTRGHSIENYMFSAEALLDYLRHHHPEAVPASMYNTVRENFDAALTWCGALTLTLLEFQLLGRADGLCRIEYWNCRDRQLDVGAYTTALASRCGQQFDSSQFSERVYHWHSALRTASPELARWIAHGHLCKSLLWVSIGKTLAAAGVDTPTAQVVATGMNSNKMRAAASWWQKQLSSNPVDAPHPLIQWLVS